MALAVLGPAVGLAVMTPYISVTSGLASDLKKDADCLKVAPEVRRERGGMEEEEEKREEKKRERGFFDFEQGTKKKQKKIPEKF